MTAVRELHYSYAEYLSALEVSTLKLEWSSGVIYAMAGGTPAHAQLAAAVIGLLHRGLPEGCRLATSDMKIRVDADDVTTFPDVSIVCGPTHTSPLDAHAVTNPSVLVEVTSRSTEDYDRGAKLESYKRLESVLAVLFVSHREQRITLVERAGVGWTEREVTSGQLAIRTPALSLSVDAVYAGITLDGA